MPNLDGPEYRQPPRESRPGIQPQPSRGDNPRSSEPVARALESRSGRDDAGKPVLFANTAEGGQGGSGKDGSLLKEPKFASRGPDTPSFQLENTFPSGYIPRGSGLSNSASANDDDKKEIMSIAEFKKRYGSLIGEKAKELGVDPNLLGATIWVESSGSGFSDGKLKIRFENHYFINDAKNDYGLFAGNKWDDKHYYRESQNDPWNLVHTGNPEDEHAAFEVAKRLNPEVAHTSVSMGLGQIMGEDYKAAGYNSAREMFDDFSKGHTPQINGMASFIKNGKNGSLLSALQNKDLREFVKLYNGEGNIEAYFKKLEEGIPIYQGN